MNKSKARITTHPEGATLEVWTGDDERGYVYSVTHLSDLVYATSNMAPSLENGWFRELPPGGTSVSPICEPCSKGVHWGCVAESNPSNPQLEPDVYVECECEHGTVVMIQPDSVVHEGRTE